MIAVATAKAVSTSEVLSLPSASLPNALVLVLPAEQQLEVAEALDEDVSRSAPHVSPNESANSSQTVG